MKFLMCRPDFYGISYEINPWMSLQHKVDHDLACQQWDKLYELIIACGADIALVPPVCNLPDMVFTANAGLLYQTKMILAHFKYAERQGEVAHYRAWFESVGFNLLNITNDEVVKPYFEGAGDALFAGERLFAGYGFRTQKKFYQQADYLDQHQLVYCELINPYFYHLDTCFCPLNEDLAICYLNAFSKETQKKLVEHLELMIVTEEEAKRFACNAVVINEHVILPTGCEKLLFDLKNKGFTAHAVEMGEYLKAGGACKCLTLRLD